MLQAAEEALALQEGKLNRETAAVQAQLDKVNSWHWLALKRTTPTCLYDVHLEGRLVQMLS